MILLFIVLCKEVFVFFDGTWNNETSQTNIWRMFNYLNGTVELNSFGGSHNVTSYIKKSHSPDRVALYLYGLGTSKDTLNNFVQAFSGFGIEGWVTVAYEFLIRYLEEHDTLRIFGFSRGATSSRVLARYLGEYGIHEDNLVNRKIEYTLLEPSFPSVVGWIPEISFVGLFDSVRAISTIQQAAAILRTQMRRLKKRSIEESLIKILDTVVNTTSTTFNAIVQDYSDFFGKVAVMTNARKMIRYSDEMLGNVIEASHAVAINEYRTMYNYSSIPTREGFQQCYFTGAHTDIGGSYYSDRGLIALQWMLQQDGLSSVFSSDILPKNYNGTAMALNYTIYDSYLEPIVGFKTNTKFSQSLLPIFYRSFVKDPIFHPSVYVVAAKLNVTLRHTLNRTLILPFLRDLEHYNKDNMTVIF